MAGFSGFGGFERYWLSLARSMHELLPTGIHLNSPELKNGQQSYLPTRKMPYLILTTVSA